MFYYLLPVLQVLSVLVVVALTVVVKRLLALMNITIRLLNAGMIALLIGVLCWLFVLTQLVSALLAHAPGVL